MFNRGSWPFLQNKKINQKNIILIWCGIVIIIVRITASSVLPLYDDAFITLRYARNLATGSGFIYNPHEWILGTTSPGFGLINALFYLLSLPMPKSVIILNILLDVAIFFLTVYSIPSKYRYIFGIFFGVLFSISPIMTRITVGGMEMNLFLFFSILSLFLYHNKHKYAAISLSALIYSLRPEALILFTVLCFVEWFTGEKIKAVKLAGTGFPILLLQLLFIYIFYGVPVSQSIIAKSSLTKPSFFTELKELLAPDPLVLILFFAALWGYLSGVKKKIWYTKIIGIWGTLYLAAYLTGRPQIWSWYGYPLDYIILVLASVAFVRITEFPIVTRFLEVRKYIPELSGLTISFIPLVIWSIVFLKVGQSNVTKDIYNPIRKWCRYNVQSKTSILAGDIGVIGYYSNAKIYDLAGLVTPEFLKFKSKKDMILNCLPDVLFLNSTQYYVHMMNSPPFNKLYVPVKRFSRNKKIKLSLNENDFPDHWVQDYIVFEKKDH